MRTILMCGLAAAALGTLSAAPVGAFPVAPLPAAGVAAPDPQVSQVQYRRHYGGYRYGYRGGYRRGYGGYGAGVGAGIAGLAAGAIIGGAIANSQAPTYYGAAPGGGDAVAYCAQRYRSYDPASGTYLGYDGVRYACP